MQKSSTSKSEESAAAARWPSWVLFAITIAWTGVMLASLKWQFLNRFVAGTFHGQQGFDFFQVPRGFRLLTAGNNMYLTELSNYNDWASSYLYHPTVVVAVGPWTAPFAPWTAYAIFVGASIFILALAAWFLSTPLQESTQKAFTFFALFCSLPTYLMLWNAQMHVFLLLAMAMIFAGLMHLAQEPEQARRYVRWIQIGILISLLSKPTVLLMLPVLFAVPELRRPLVTPVVTYAVISLAFLFVPGLNPGGYNAEHWLNIIQASSSPMQVYRLVFPQEMDASTSHEMYSLPFLLLKWFGHSFPLILFRIPVLLVLGLSLTPFAMSERQTKIRLAVVVAALSILSHYLSYYLAFEYHYTTALLLLPVLLWLWQTETNLQLRRCSMVAFWVSTVMFLPTLYFLTGDDHHRYEMLCALLRLMPVLASFGLLMLYVFVSVWPTLKGHFKAFAKHVAAQLWADRWPALTIALSLAIVARGVFYITPERLLKTPSHWSGDDWVIHLEDIASRPGIYPIYEAKIRQNLAVFYAKTNPDAAQKHLEIGHALAPADLNISLDLAAFYISRHRLNDAKTLLSSIPPDQIQDRDLRNNLLHLRHSAGLD